MYTKIYKKNTRNQNPTKKIIQEKTLKNSRMRILLTKGPLNEARRKLIKINDVVLNIFRTNSRKDRI